MCLHTAESLCDTIKIKYENNTKDVFESTVVQHQAKSFSNHKIRCTLTNKNFNRYIS